MTLLQKLGVECSYDTYGTGELHYSISIDTEQLRYREQAINYFTKIIKAIYKDISRKNQIGEPYRLILSVNDRYIDDLQRITQDLLSTAKTHKQTLDDFTDIRIDSAFRYPPIGCGIIAGGLVGLALSYSQMAKWATTVASLPIRYGLYLLAPKAELIQTGISVLETATIAAIGAACGAIGGIMFSYCGVVIRAPSAGRVSIYQSLEEALSQARTNPKKKDNYTIL